MLSDKASCSVNTARPFRSNSFDILLVGFRIWKYIGVTCARVGNESNGTLGCYNKRKSLIGSVKQVNP